MEKLPFNLTSKAVILASTLVLCACGGTETPMPTASASEIPLTPTPTAALTSYLSCETNAAGQTSADSTCVCSKYYVDQVLKKSGVEYKGPKQVWIGNAKENKNQACLPAETKPTETPTPALSVTPAPSPTPESTATKILKDEFIYYPDPKGFDYQTPNDTTFHFPKGYYNEWAMQQVFDPYCGEPLGVKNIPVHFEKSIITTKNGSDIKTYPDAQGITNVSWSWWGLTNYDQVDVYVLLNVFLKSFLAKDLYSTDNFNTLEFDATLVHEIAGTACRLKPEITRAEYAAEGDAEDKEVDEGCQKRHDCTTEGYATQYEYLKNPLIFVKPAQEYSFSDSVGK